MLLRFPALRRLRLSSLVALTALGLPGGASLAQGQLGPAFPTKVISIVVPAPPGGVTDTLGRMLAPHFSEAWGQQAIVEIRASLRSSPAAPTISRRSSDW